MAARPFCLILEYSYPFELQPVARCGCWRDQPLPTVRIVFPEPDFGRNINSRFAKDLDAYQEVLAFKAVQGNDRRGREDQFLRPRPSRRYLF